MSRDGSGGYSVASSSWNPATNGNSATAADWNALLADLTAAIQGSIAADGQTPITGSLNFGNNKATALAAATSTGDGLRLENIIAGADIASASTVTIPLEGNYFSITGTTTINGFAATRNGRTVFISFAGSLTLTNSTSFATGTGANIVTTAGDISIWSYDGTNWNCVYYRGPVAVPIRDALTIVASAATGAINFDALNQSILSYTVNASGNFSLNVRGNSGNTLNSVMAIGQTISITFQVQMGSTPYTLTNFYIDGGSGSVSLKTPNGLGIGTGTASSLNVFTFAIEKTAANTYTVLGSKTAFA